MRWSTAKGPGSCKYLFTGHTMTESRFREEWSGMRFSGVRFVSWRRCLHFHSWEGVTITGVARPAVMSCCMIMCLHAARSIFRLKSGRTEA